MIVMGHMPKTTSPMLGVGMEKKKHDIKGGI
jgi:hypothetical protein